jgi:hypothetical protein
MTVMDHQLVVNVKRQKIALDYRVPIVFLFAISKQINVSVTDGISQEEACCSAGKEDRG